MNVKKEKVQVKEEPRDEKTGSVDQIKKKYGFSLTGVSIHPHVRNMYKVKNYVIYGCVWKM